MDWFSNRSGFKVDLEPNQTWYHTFIHPSKHAEHLVVINPDNEVILLKITIVMVPQIPYVTGY